MHVQPLRRVRALGAQPGRALTLCLCGARRRSFLHGDIKPSNVLLSRRHGTRLLHAIIADLGGGTTFGPTGPIEACRCVLRAVVRCVDVSRRRASERRG